MFLLHRPRRRWPVLLPATVPRPARGHDWADCIPKAAWCRNAVEASTGEGSKCHDLQRMVADGVVWLAPGAARRAHQWRDGPGPPASGASDSNTRRKADFASPVEGRAGVLPGATLPRVERRGGAVSVRSSARCKPVTPSAGDHNSSSMPAGQISGTPPARRATGTNPAAMASCRAIPSVHIGTARRTRRRRAGTVARRSETPPR